MAIIDVQIGDIRRGRVDRDWNREYTVQFKVLCTSKFDDQSYVLSNFTYFGSPIKIGTAYPGDAYAFATNIEAEWGGIVEGTAGLWYVTVDYGPRPVAQPAENPLNTPPEVLIEGESYERITTKDKDGKAILNAAGDMFLEPLSKNKTKIILRIIRNEPTFDPATVLAYSNDINDATWYGFPAKTVMFHPPHITKVPSQYLHETTGVDHYWRISYVFEYNPETWTKKILNQGMYELKDGKKVQILDSAGQPITSPAALKTDGEKVPIPVTDADVNFKDFELYDTRDFDGTFGFPGTLFV